MTFRIKPQTATRQKRPRQTSDKHLAWIRTLPSVISGKRGCEACHIRYGDDAYGKRPTGMQEKPDDRFTVPMTAFEHREQHGGSERSFWLQRGIDPCKKALALWANTGDDDAAMKIISEDVSESSIQPAPTDIQCPCCGSSVNRVDPKEAIKYIKMSPMQKRIIETLVSRFGQLVPRDRLIMSMYEDKWDGEPENAANILSITIMKIRRNNDFTNLGVVLDSSWGEGCRLRWRREGEKP